MSITKADLIEALKHLIYGSQGAQLQQKTGTYELLTEDTAAHIREALREEIQGISVPRFLFSKAVAYGVPILDVGAGGAWDSAGVACASVFREGSYHMLYHGWAVPFFSDIGYASSPDGLTWTKEPTNPVLTRTPGTWDANLLAATGNCIIKKLYGGVSQYLLYYYGHDGTIAFGETNFRVGIAFSTDLKTWAKYAGNPVFLSTVDEPRVKAPSIVEEPDGSLKMYYGYRTSGIYRIGLATSSDGFTWTRYANNPVLEVSNVPDMDQLIEHMSVVKVGGLYIMVYEATIRLPRVPRVYYHLFRAYSYDGVHWQKIPQPLLSGSLQTGQYDAYGAVHPCLVPDGGMAGTGRTLLFHTALDDAVVHRVGVAFVDTETYPVRLWRSATVLVAGARTRWVDCAGFDKKTIYLLSDQNGSLTIELIPDGEDPTVAGNWRNYDNVSVSANVLMSYIMTGNVRLARLSFVPLGAATVSAWAVMS